MNRTLTAAVALATALGMAGIAQAQTNANPPGSPLTTAPSASQPGMSGTQKPASMSTPGSTSGASSTYGAQNPQANAQPSQMPGSQQTSQSNVQQAQEQLKAQGLYHGAVDGIVGPETQNAVMAFQRKQGLPQTAQLDQQTLNRLNGAGGTQGGAPTTKR